MTRVRFAASRPARREQGFTLIELLIVVALIGVIASIAIPSLISARAAANEASAIGSSRTASSSQNAYGGFYATSMLQLSLAGFASADFALPIKHGFAYNLSVGDTGMLGPLDCNGDPTMSDFYYSATPTTPNLGRRGFAVTEDGGIWVDNAGVAPVEPFVVGGTIQPLQ